MSTQGPRSMFAPFQHRPRDVHREVQEHLSGQDRIALALTSAIGTMYAVYIFLAVIVLWTLLQSGQGSFDPYPFAFLLFLGNIVQLLLMPLIMVGQNVQNRHVEARAGEQYLTVTKTFHDLEAVLAHLDQQDRDNARLRPLLTALITATIPEPERTSLLRQAGSAKPE